MKLWKLIILTAFFGASESQNRRFFHRRHQRGRNNFADSHRNHRQFHYFEHQKNIKHVHNVHKASINMCSNIEFLRALDNRWYGSFTYDPIRDEKGINIELEFNESVIGLVNDFSHSTSLDNKFFTISDDSKLLKQGELIHFNFFVNFNDSSSFPLIAKVKFNSIQLCSDDTISNKCAKLYTISNDTGESYEGALTIYPHQFDFGRLIDFHFSVNLLAFVNNIGDSITNDQKHFTVKSNYYTNNQAFIINFLAKYDIFEKRPELQEVYVDNLPICLSNDDDLKRTSLYSTAPPSFQQAKSNLKLEDLPFHLFPNITAVPTDIFIDNHDCGKSINYVSLRVDNGEIANLGQFPFHAAIFYDSFYRCAGTLLSERATLTAAHCVVNFRKKILPPEKFHLLFGSIDLESLTGTENLRTVAKIIKHPNYEHSKILKQDIAIMIINGSVLFTNYISPICISKILQTNNEEFNKDLIVLGFGSTVDSLEPSRYLHHGEMTVISREQCTENLIFALLPDNSTFCAKSKENGLVCPGDSGGGIVERVDDKYYLRGIVSVTVTGANGRCSIENPVGFTDINAFLPWISENMNQ